MNLRVRTLSQPSFDLLSKEALPLLKEKKNLLAFSAGVDSSALFFLLLDAGISFDIAIVDYGMREQSKEEVAHAQSLAAQYDKVCYHDSITLPQANFEHHARQHRYQFFEKIIHQYHYDTLLTAHQLNDRLEWFLMQLGKGAGLVEILGFEMIESRSTYQLIRPLIQSEKKDLLAYLDYHDKPYFIDESNYHDSYKRNQIRSHFANEFLENFSQGVQKSFEFLQRDKEALFEHHILYQEKEFFLLPSHAQSIRSIDKVCKHLGYLLSEAQRKEIEEKREVVVGGKIAIAWKREYIFIAPFYQESMPKPFKESCRIQGIPAQIRPYLYVKGIKLSCLPLS